MGHITAILFLFEHLTVLVLHFHAPNFHTIVISYKIILSSEFDNKCNRLQISSFVKCTYKAYIFCDTPRQQVNLQFINIIIRVQGLFVCVCVSVCVCVTKTLIIMPVRGLEIILGFHF